MCAILFGIAVIFLFPVWPLIVKKGIYYTSLILLYLIIGTLLLRLILYLIVRVFGFDFWFLPRFLEDVNITHQFY